MNWLKYLVGLSAILIAGCAAFFSVTGLGVLFAGASTSVMVMAGSLEFAKLVAATYLKQTWDEIKGFNKWYLTIAVATLMIITSAGIFGYLSNAFQQQNLALQQVDREIAVYQTKIDQNTTQINQLTEQLNNLSQTQNTILDKGKVNNRLLRSIDNKDKQAAILNKKIAELQDSSASSNATINTIKTSNLNLEKEVGGFRFVAEAFGVPLNTVVKFFIFIIVIVFDPLAVALIIAFNGLVMKRKDDDLMEKNYQIYGDNGKKSTKDEQREALVGIMKNDEDLGLYDENGENTAKGDEMEDYINTMNDEILEKYNLELSENDIKTIIDNVENSPAPNEALIEAAEEYATLTDEDKKALESEITDEILLGLKSDFSKRPIDLDNDGSVDGYDTDGDGLIDIANAHPNNALLIKNMKPYYAKDDFDWNDRKTWINDQNAVNYWIKYIKPEQYPTDFSGKSY